MANIATIIGNVVADSGVATTSLASSIHTHAFADLTAKPTTLAGYGITDAASSTHNHNGTYWAAEGSWKPASLASSTRLIGKTSPDGGEFALAYSGGQIHVYTDGFFYQNEGQYIVIDSNSIGSQSVSYASSSGSATNATNTTYMNTTFLGSGSISTNEGRCMSLRTDSGAGAAVNYSPVLHMAASDTMWQIQGTYGGSGNGTLYFRQGYAGSWGNWLTMLSSANYSSYAMPISGGTFTGAIALNDQRLYFRTNGDVNHYMWNAGDDWEELVAYSGTGFRVQSSNGYTIAAFVSGGADGNEINIGPDTGGNNGLRLNSGDCSACYSRIRFRHGGTERQQIHVFSPSWQGGSLSGQSSGAINIAGYNGVTFGVWNNVAGYVDNTGNAWFRGNVTAYSDARVKTDVKIIENPLDKINAIRGVTYLRTDSIYPNRHMGVIAQELLQIVPEVVEYDSADRYSVAYGNLSGLFIEAFKEHDKLIKAQADQIKQLKEIIDGFTK